MLRRVLVVSALAHVAVFALVRGIEVPVEAVEPAPPTYTPFEVGFDEIITEPSTAPAAPAPSAPLAMAVVPGSSGPSTTESAASSEPAPPSEPAPVASNGTWIVSGLSLGIAAPGQINPFLGRGVLPAGSAETNGAATTATADPMYIPEDKRAEQAVKDALRARDHALGLGPEGPVITALEAATHAGFAPEQGTATFVAVIDERGIVVDLKLTSSSASGKAGAQGWEDVRARAVKSLASAKIQMRGVKRAELTIAVESKVVLPSGNDPKKPITPTAKPTAVVTRSNAPGSPSGADVAAGATVAEFDLTDIGAKKTRTVHAKLVLMRSL
ncbi:MAG: hypothetical protein KIT84_12280 [Labilithrix sp.]|nr:hypothetical protein [Labilithrix sp.]MCW5811790.1 hypothetical protein [Labilithrix sp.]